VVIAKRTMKTEEKIAAELAGFIECGKCHGMFSKDDLLHYMPKEDEDMSVCRGCIKGLTIAWKRVCGVISRVDSSDDIVSDEEIRKHREWYARGGR